MGCDIHMHIEYRPLWVQENKNKREPDLEWFCWAEDVDGCGDYDMFGIIAGVRNSFIKPLVLPRGIPKNLGYQVKDRIERIGSDGHTHTWLTPKEFTIICALRQLTDDALIENYNICKEWLALRDVLNTLAKHYGEKHVRLIVYFDS